MAKPKKVEAEVTAHVPTMVTINPHEIVIPDADTGELGRFAVPTVEKLSKLAYSMHKEGQQSLIRVTQTDGVYNTVYGNCRTLAGRMIRDGFEWQEVKVHDPDFMVRAEVVTGTPKQLFMSNLAENASRVELSTMDIARNLQTAKEVHGIKGELLCQMYDMDKTYISKYLKLLTLPLPIQMMIHEGKLNLPKGLALASAKPALTEEEMVVICSNTDDLSLSMMMQRISEIHGGTPAKLDMPDMPEPSMSEPVNTDRPEDPAEDMGKKTTMKDVLSLLRTQIITKGSNNGKPNDNQSSVMSTFCTAVLLFAEKHEGYDSNAVQLLADGMNRRIRAAFKERSYEEENAGDKPGSAPIQTNNNEE